MVILKKSYSYKKKKERTILFEKAFSDSWKKSKKSEAIIKK